MSDAIKALQAACVRTGLVAENNPAGLAVGWSLNKNGLKLRAETPVASQTRDIGWTTLALLYNLDASLKRVEEEVISNVLGVEFKYA